MKKNKFIIMLGISVFLVGIISVCSSNDHCDNLVTKKTMNQEKQVKVLKLNPLGKNADDTAIKNVNIDKENKNLFGKSRKAYSVKKIRYTEKDLKKIAGCLNTKVEKMNEDNGIKSCNLNNKGVLIYYDNSGSITYISEDSTLQEMPEKYKLNKNKCVKVAEKFLKKSNIIDYKCLVLDNVEVGYTIETSKGERPLSYQITFMKKQPKGVDGFAGIGPGIRVDVDCKYNITSFTSVNKEITELDGEYSTLSLEEAEKKIESNGEVQLSTDTSNLKNNTIENVDIDNVEVRLYSDSTNLKQEYMAPYYVFSGKDNNGAAVLVTIPAVSDEEFRIKE